VLWLVETGIEVVMERRGSRDDEAQGRLE